MSRIRESEESERSASCPEFAFINRCHFSLTTTMAKTKKSTGQPSSNKRAKHEEPTLTEDEKRVVMIQFNKENEADTKTADALLKEYLKFMQVGAHCIDLVLSPVDSNNYNIPHYLLLSNY